jgi:hypothetical protein
LAALRLHVSSKTSIGIAIMTNRRKWMLMIGGFIAVVGIASLIGLLRNPAAVPHSEAERPVGEQR